MPRFRVIDTSLQKEKSKDTAPPVVGNLKCTRCHKDLSQMRWGGSFMLTCLNEDCNCYRNPVSQASRSKVVMPESVLNGQKHDLDNRIF